MAKKQNGGQQGPGGITKWDAVRQALEEMGRDAKPLAIQAHLRDRLGMEVKTSLISVYKKELVRKARKGKKPKKPAAVAKEGAIDQLIRQPKPATAGGGKEAGIPLSDILYVKGLVGRFGPEQLHTLIDAFAR